MPLVRMLKKTRLGGEGDLLELPDSQAAQLVCVGEAVIVRYDSSPGGARVREGLSMRAPKELQDELDEGSDPRLRRSARRGR